MSDQNKATCKVVTIEGQKGRKIYPEDCKVRYKVVGGRVRKISKATGRVKPEKVTMVEKGMVHKVRLLYPGDEYADPKMFTWDTGAGLTVMSRRVAYDMGIITSPNKDWKPVDGLEEGKTGVARDAGQKRYRIRTIKMYHWRYCQRAGGRVKLCEVS